MKTFFLALLLPLSSFVITVSRFDNKEIKKNFVKITPSIYISKYETTNEEYRRFVHYLKNSGKMDLWDKCVPDSNSWTSMRYCEPLANFYFSHPAYNKYPVVAINQDAVIEYCKWLTEKYNTNSKGKFKKVIFRLPTKEEWVFAANCGDTLKQYTWGTGFVKNNRGHVMCNFKEWELVYDSATKKYKDQPAVSSNVFGTKFTGPVKSFFANTFGIYNMCGNVAEMISEKGIAKGGSYADPADRVTIASEKNYTQSQPDIGFRVVMEIVEK